MMFAVIAAFSALLVMTHPSVTEEEELLLVMSAETVMQLYNDGRFEEIADSLVDDKSLGEDRTPIDRSRRILQALFRQLNKATGRCSESIDDYRVGRTRSIPRFQIAFELDCEKRPLELVLHWGRKSGQLFFIGYSLPVSYYSDIPEIREHRQEIWGTGQR